MNDNTEFPQEDWENEGGTPSDEAAEDKTFEPDPSVIAHLDQEGAAFAEMSDAFKQTFGFEHKCHCAEDYASGKVVEVTECFTGLVDEALLACQNLMEENFLLRSMLTQMFAAVNASQAPTEEAEVNDDDDQ